MGGGECLDGAIFGDGSLRAGYSDYSNHANHSDYPIGPDHSGHSDYSGTGKTKAGCG